VVFQLKLKFMVLSDLEWLKLMYLEIGTLSSRIILVLLTYQLVLLFYDNLTLSSI